ncbi:MAG: sn-glycerol-3-phosphate ABC transporter permease UgpA [Rhodospirillaceae bacterium]
MEKRVIYNNRVLPYLLLLPQIAITAVFFLWPAAQAVRQSFLREDIFGLSSQWVWFENYVDLFASGTYASSLWTTIVFAVGTTALSMGAALILAAALDRVVAAHAGRGRGDQGSSKAETGYQTLLIWPYAMAPAVAGVLFFFLFNPTIGILAYILQSLGYDWNHILRGSDAMIMVIIAAAWKQVSYNFLFFLAAMQSIPKGLIEAAAIDGAGPIRRFWTIHLPLISPTTFFLLVVNLVYAFFDTFSLIHATTSGGPAKATEILVYKVFNDGFIGLDLGGSAAQSVVLMMIVGVLTVVQFRYVERKVQYG